MKGMLLSIYDAGNVVGYYGCWLYVLIMAVACVYVMRKYLKG
ncbi:MAG TPA: hypothetical protein PLP34_01330 [Chitinophagaceae bacterium]|nr:hypothetical protein [Chitinophagaceae bacterium]HNF71019.1 hypothetical protein [Chitinophagaceae bacterium]